MRHNRKSFLVGNMDQLPYLFIRKGFFCQSSPVKIHNAGDHDFYKLSAFFSQRFDQFCIFLHIPVGSPHNSSIMSVSMDSKNGGAIGDTVLRSDFFCPPGGSINISSIPQPGNAPLPIFFKIFPYHTLVHTLRLGFHSFLIVISIHKNMKMALTKRYFLYFCFHTSHSLRSSII